jgi:hypothetical protein
VLQRFVAEVLASKAKHLGITTEELTKRLNAGDASYFICTGEPGWTGGLERLASQSGSKAIDIPLGEPAHPLGELLRPPMLQVPAGADD